MKTIKIGDRVQAHWDSRIKGTAIEFINEHPGDWMVGSTSSPVIYCIIELDDGSRIKYKLSDLHYDYDN